MNVKNLVAGTLGGGLVYFLLGWVFYEMLFTNIYPDNGNQNMVFIFIGCLVFTLLLTYIFTQWANITNPMTGAKAGALVGLLYGLSMNFFMYACMTPNYGNMILDTLITAIMAGAAGAVIAFILGKLK
jgi:hypothetical protein